MDILDTNVEMINIYYFKIWNLFVENKSLERNNS